MEQSSDKEKGIVIDRKKTLLLTQVPHRLVFEYELIPEARHK